MTDTNQPPDRTAATVAYVETSLANLARAMREACDVAALPHNTPWRGIIERAVYPLTDPREEARGLL